MAGCPQRQDGVGRQAGRPERSPSAQRDPETWKLERPHWEAALPAFPERKTDFFRAFPLLGSFPGEMGPYQPEQKPPVFADTGERGRTGRVHAVGHDTGTAGGATCGDAGDSHRHDFQQKEKRRGLHMTNPVDVDSWSGQRMAFPVAAVTAPTWWLEQQPFILSQC